REMATSNDESGQIARAPVAHAEEFFSILMTVGAAIGAVVYFWIAPGFSPQSYAWAMPGWIAGAYLVLQILFLLVSASQVRALGVLDLVLAILPVVIGLVIFVEWLLGHLPMSLFQLNVLGLLIATALAEFLLTVWIRFVINRRTIGFGTT